MGDIVVYLASSYTFAVCREKERERERERELAVKFGRARNERSGFVGVYVQVYSYVRVYVHVSMYECDRLLSVLSAVDLQPSRLDACNSQSA